jgi:hypothetical protein
VTGSQTLLPLRIPELGPSLGKLVVGTGRRPGGLVLDDIRHHLVTRLFEHAGEARRLAANGERAPAIAALSRANWLAAWEEAAGGVAERVLQHVDEQLIRQADRVRLPAALRDRFVPGAAERRALTARVGSAAAALVPALDALERHGGDAFGATALERAAMEAWLDGLRTAARRLEAAWLELEELVETEVRRWGPVAEEVGRWRRPLWPVWLVGGAALAGALWLGLALGGFIPAPAWLMPLIIALPR